MKTKGYTLENLLDYISKTQDEGVAAELRGKLPEDITSGSWYPMDALFEALEILEQRSDKERGAVSRELGRFKAVQAARGPYRLFFVFASPRFVIKKASAFWGFYHDWGAIKVKEHHEKGVDFTIEHQDEIPDLYLHTIAGWVEKSLEIAGAKSPTVEFTAGEKEVEVRARWE